MPTDKQLYRIDWGIYVQADTEEEAVDIARGHYREMAYALPNLPNVTVSLRKRKESATI
jgi:hypothetical protein